MTALRRHEALVCIYGMRTACSSAAPAMPQLCRAMPAMPKRTQSLLLVDFHRTHTPPWIERLHRQCMAAGCANRNFVFCVLPETLDAFGV